MECQGECKKEGSCTGTVKKVNVSGGGFKGPFEFNYCETAIKEDQRRGFVVEGIDEMDGITCFSCGGKMTLSPSEITYECGCGYWCYTRLPRFNKRPSSKRRPNPIRSITFHQAQAN